jgi:hypothetical protein
VRWPQRRTFSFCLFGGYGKVEAFHELTGSKPRSALPIMVAGLPGGKSSVRGEQLCQYVRDQQDVISRNAGKCAFALGTQAQYHVWDFVEYKQIKLVYCATGATSGWAGRERKSLWAYRPLRFMRARLADHTQEICWAALQKTAEKILGAAHRLSELRGDGYLEHQRRDARAACSGSSSHFGRHGRRSCNDSTAPRAARTQL